MMNLEYDTKEAQQAAFKWLLAFGSTNVPIKTINDAYAAGDLYHTVLLRGAGYLKRTYSQYDSGLQLTPEGLEHLKCL